MNGRMLFGLFAGLLTLLPLAACQEREAAKSRPVAQVNGYVIGEQEFRCTLSSSAYFRDLKGLSFEERKELLDEQVRKELLIQEAVKRGVDQEDDFRRTIENYWQQTLIATLLKRQCAELDKYIVVTREEIDDRYRAAAGPGAPMPPPEEVMAGLQKEIREEKKTRALEKWVDGLKDKADIRVYEETLASIR